MLLVLISVRCSARAHSVRHRCRLLLQLAVHVNVVVTKVSRVCVADIHMHAHSMKPVVCAAVWLYRPITLELCEGTVAAPAPAAAAASSSSRSLSSTPSSTTVPALVGNAVSQQHLFCNIPAAVWHATTRHCTTTRIISCQPVYTRPFLLRHTHRLQHKKLQQLPPLHIVHLLLQLALELALELELGLGLQPQHPQLPRRRTHPSAPAVQRHSTKSLHPHPSATHWHNCCVHC